MEVGQHDGGEVRNITGAACGFVHYIERSMNAN
jgi:hypothetical protein